MAISDDSLRSPFDLCKLVFHLGGFLCSPDAKFPLLVYINIVIQVCGILLFSMSSSFHVLFTNDPFEERFESAQFFVSMLHINVKHLNILINRKTILALLGKLEIMWEDAKLDPKNMEILKKSNKKLFKLIPILESFVVCLCPFTAITSLMWNLFIRSPDQPQKLPLKIWIPFDSEKHFWLASAYVNYTFFAAIMSATTSMCFLTIICEEVSLQIRILQRLISQRDPMEPISNDAYILHQKILRIVRELNDFLSGILMWEMLISALQVSARGYTCIQAMIRKDMVLINNLYMLSTCTLAPFTVCANGEVISSQGEALFKTAYQNLWYEERVADKKSLLLLQTMTARPITLHYKHLLTFGMIQFMRMLQATYSYLTMITSIYL